MTLHINACRLTKKPQKIIRCCHFLIFVVGWRNRSVCHCNSLFWSVGQWLFKESSEQGGKVLCSWHSSENLFFLLWEWWFHTFGAKAQETSMEVGVGTKVKICLAYFTRTCRCIRPSAAGTYHAFAFGIMIRSSTGIGSQELPAFAAVTMVRSDIGPLTTWTNFTTASSHAVRF